MKKVFVFLLVALAMQSITAAPKKGDSPKYIFLFIGDGMSYPQFQAAAAYCGVLESDEYMKAAPSVKDRGGVTLKGPKALNFMGFPVAGSAVTYDSCSFAPDSASTATSIASGHKTYSGSINVDETGTKKYETISETLHKKGVKIGIISSVNLNHATPAAFYAHNASRGNYYDIGRELVASGFEYFAGGAFLKPDYNGQEDLLSLAKKAGYKVATTKEEFEKVKNTPAIIIDSNLQDDGAMTYAIDKASGAVTLADYVKKGVELLDNDKGFFIMCEGGKIDWACHANDAATTIGDVLELSRAVQVAIDFSKKHKSETLILVTGDHETGGLTIGFAGTDYDVYLSLLKAQKISFVKYDSDYVASYKANNTSFQEVLKDIEKLFGLKNTGDKGDKLVLSDYEKGLLEVAYKKTLSAESVKKENTAEYVAYGTYEPLSVTITHILNNKSGVSFTSYSHTGLPVAVFASGVREKDFEGFYDNTKIYEKLAAITKIK